MSNKMLEKKRKKKKKMFSRWKDIPSELVSKHMPTFYTNKLFLAMAWRETAQARIT